ncbi:MAG: geranylgeranylglyceryl/heptaprenylglyceryl phosphate synthase, partial [Bacteroidia bacterium]
MKKNIYNRIIENKGRGKKMLAVLIDPDSISEEQGLAKTCEICNEAKVDFILTGGSLITNGYFEQCVRVIKKNTKIPVILFPGNVMQVSEDADAILFLSLISGRNPELLIGKHVIAAPMLKKSKLEIIPTGYI